MDIKVVCINETVDYAFRIGEVYSIIETQNSVPINGDFTYYKIKNVWFVSAKHDFFYIGKYFTLLSDIRDKRIDEILNYD